MPSLRRVCLVCRGATTTAYLGLDLCRACSVFYKRSIGRERYECGGSGDCEIKNEGRSCRACRQELIEKALKGSPDCSNPEVEETVKVEEDDYEDDLPDEPETSLDCIDKPIQSSPTFLESLRTNYRSMSFTRMTAELHGRKEPPHPLMFDVDNPPMYPTTYCTIDLGNRVLMSASPEFASATFPRFAKLSKQMKWKLVLNFFYRIRFFEGCYRANKHFPDHMDRSLMSYTAWMSMEDLEYFFSDCPSGDIDGAIKYMSTRNVQGIGIPTCREIMARLAPSEDEFLFVLALMFWSVDGISDCEQEVIDVAALEKVAIHKAMHAHYRDDLHMDNYASRMGELLSYVTLFDVSEHVKQHYEMFRLFGLFKEDSFTYLLKNL